MEKAVKFINVFNILDRELQQRAGFEKGKGTFAGALGRVKKQRDVLLYRHFDELYTINELRNAIVHESQGEEELIADPHDKWIEKTEDILRRLQNPRNCLHVSIIDVYKMKMDDDLKATLMHMKENSFSVCPIVNEDGAIVKILSEYSLLKFFADNAGDATIIEASKISDLSEWLDDPLEKDISAAYEFVGKAESEFKIAEIFDSYLAKRSRLLAVFITEHGKPTEKPIGIFTSYDLPKIGD